MGTPTAPYYVVTGVSRDGKRFRITTSFRVYAHKIDLWRGSVWRIDPATGRRKLEKRVRN